MPIRPENRHRYGEHWLEIRSWILGRAGMRCECRGECEMPHQSYDGPRCTAAHGGMSSATVARVVLTIAHLDHTPEHNDPANLRAMCQGCHLRYDRDHHAATRRHTERMQLAAAGQLTLGGMEGDDG